MFQEVCEHMQHNQRLLGGQLTVVAQLGPVMVSASYGALREFYCKHDRHVQQKIPTMSLVCLHPISLSQISP